MTAISHAALSADVDSAEAVNKKSSCFDSPCISNQHANTAWQILPYTDRTATMHLAEHPKVSWLFKEMPAHLILKCAAGFRPIHWC